MTRSPSVFLYLLTLSAAGMNPVPISPLLCIYPATVSDTFAQGGLLKSSAEGTRAAEAQHLG